MRMNHKIRLEPNNEQETYFLKACGCSRLAYNWGLEQWKKECEAGNTPSGISIKKQFDAIKEEQFPFVYEVTKTAYERSFIDLEQDFKRFFKGQSRYPRFKKKKGRHDSFYISAQLIKVYGNKLRVPKLGWVRMTEPLLFEGRISSVTISRIDDMWFASFNLDVLDTPGH